MRGGGSVVTRDKWQHINQLLRNGNVALLALQETHLKEEQIHDLHAQFPARLHILSSSDPANPNSKGVAVVINKQKFKHWARVSANEIIHGQALLVNVPWGENSSISVLNDHRLARPDIVLGDMNFVKDAIDRLPTHPDPAPILESFNDFKQQLNLDRIYISPTLLTKSQNWDSSATAILTDHKLVSVQVSNPATPAMGRGRWMIPLFALKKRKVIQEIERLGRALEEKWALRNIREDNTMQTDYLCFKEDVTTFVRKFVKTEIPKLDSRIRKEKERLQLLEIKTKSLAM
ncbi:hypothetical protein CPC08DRAFT_737937 [Agrocybe pediades]|nr:hypothetical protein CPC08DRAFT_737937 [Agrocybe pediades]